jgi:hypothetical protein
MSRFRRSLPPSRPIEGFGLRRKTAANVTSLPILRGKTSGIDRLIDPEVVLDPTDTGNLGHSSRKDSACRPTSLSQILQGPYDRIRTSRAALSRRGTPGLGRNARRPTS